MCLPHSQCFCQHQHPWLAECFLHYRGISQYTTYTKNSCFVVFSVKYCYGPPLTEFTVFATSRSCLPYKNLEWPIKDTLCKFGTLYSKMWYSLWNQQPTHGTILVFYCCIANCSKLSSLKQHKFCASSVWALLSWVLSSQGCNQGAGWAWVPSDPGHPYFSRLVWLVGSVYSLHMSNSWGFTASRPAGASSSAFYSLFKRLTW